LKNAGNRASDAAVIPDRRKKIHRLETTNEQLHHEIAVLNRTSVSECAICPKVLNLSANEPAIFLKKVRKS